MSHYTDACAFCGFASLFPHITSLFLRKANNFACFTLCLSSGPTGRVFHTCHSQFFSNWFDRHVIIAEVLWKQSSYILAVSWTLLLLTSTNYH